VHWPRACRLPASLCHSSLARPITRFRSACLFIRYAEAGALPVGAAVSAVHSNLKRRELRTRLPVLSLSILVLVIALIAELIASLPHQSNQAFVYHAAMGIAPSHVDTAPLDVGLSPDDQSSASNSLAPLVATFRSRRRHPHHISTYSFGDRWSVAAPDRNGETTQAFRPSGDLGVQSVGDPTSSAD